MPSTNVAVSTPSAVSNKRRPRALSSRAAFSAPVPQVVLSRLGRKGQVGTNHDAATSRVANRAKVTRTESDTDNINNYINSKSETMSPSSRKRLEREQRAEKDHTRVRQLTSTLEREVERRKELQLKLTELQRGQNSKGRRNMTGGSVLTGGQLVRGSTLPHAQRTARQHLHPRQVETQLLEKTNKLQKTELKLQAALSKLDCVSSDLVNCKRELSDSQVKVDTLHELCTDLLARVAVPKSLAQTEATQKRVFGVQSGANEKHDINKRDVSQVRPGFKDIVAQAACEPLHVFRQTDNVDQVGDSLMDIIATRLETISQLIPMQMAELSSGRSLTQSDTGVWNHGPVVATARPPLLPPQNSQLSNSQDAFAEWTSLQAHNVEYEEQLTQKNKQEGRNGYADGNGFTNADVSIASSIRRTSASSSNDDKDAPSVEDAELLMMGKQGQNAGKEEVEEEEEEKCRMQVIDGGIVRLPKPYARMGHIGGAEKPVGGGEEEHELMGHFNNQQQQRRNIMSRLK